MENRITTAGVLIIDGRFLIAKRIESGSIGGMWEFVGGKNRWGESEEETLKREFLEELDLAIEVEGLIHSHFFINKETRYHLKAYLVHLSSPFKPRLTVHTELRWVSLNELKEYAMAPSDQEIVSTLRSLLSDMDRDD
ncbi:MAG TPA: NUDIX domain-containing protein [Sphaerochaeta sp.]|mgnify:CR=1 FL=1|jgi:8-oxo-dGTP diphosphatase|nr:NUDIX domain-containing protein [Spirochaetota bacterium]NLV60305.1 NUDIX domain-containing protein [Spirochaetales bacterium]HPY11335.1 NUDIX domain-containing protein [Sphaerochaeta sp.]HQB90674.1 NUDIX domain-containing protein [Sphaerochaeta sp.]